MMFPMLLWYIFTTFVNRLVFPGLAVVRCLASSYASYSLDRPTGEWASSGRPVELGQKLKDKLGILNHEYVRKQNNNDN